MSPLKVPESGLHLAAGEDASLPPQAFAVQLNDSVVENMIKCIQDGGKISLDLGSKPTFHYGSKSHRISPPSDSAPFDLYLTKPFESTRKAERLPNTSTLFKKFARPPKSRAKEIAAGADVKRDSSGKSSTSSGFDSDIEALKDGLAAHDAARERAHVVNKMPSTKKAHPQAKSKLLSGYGSTPRSMPTSPALNGISSPASTPTLTSSQQLMERHRELRSPLVHELATRNQTMEYLREKWGGKQEDFKHHLEKAAESVSGSKEWALKTMYWKELNVWDYDYDTQEDRQLAIDNAIRRYDKQRLGPSEPEWQKLLPKEERGKGKCLSKLQARLDMVERSAPKIKVQKADDSSSSKDDGDALARHKAKTGGESMSRSSSNPLPAKSKKPSAQEAQFKRMSNPKARSAVQKPSPTKAKGAAKANGGRVLSQAIIENSDSSGDEAPVVKKAPAEKPAPKPRPVPAAKPRPQPRESSGDEAPVWKAKAAARPAPKVKDTVVVKPKALPREPVKQQATKRPREDDDDSSSSSGTPLAHRLPGKQVVRPTKQMKQRPADSNHKSRGSTASQPVKYKNTSPIKSSPLASSPPTNASDLDHDRPPASKKRKAEVASKETMARRQAARNVPKEVMNKAQTFKLFYQKYEALHYEISALDNPPNKKVADLLDMRVRLEDMKKEIYERYHPDRD